MTKISAGAGLGIKLAITRFQNIDPSFHLSWEEEVPDSMSDADKLKRSKEILSICRQECADRIDEDIENVTGKKVYTHIKDKE